MANETKKRMEKLKQKPDKKVGLNIYVTKEFKKAVCEMSDKDDIAIGDFVMEFCWEPLIQWKKAIK